MGSRGRTIWPRKSFRLAVENSPQYTQAHLNLGLTLAASERFLEAEKSIRAALTLDTRSMGCIDGARNGPG